MRCEFKTLLHAILKEHDRLDNLKKPINPKSLGKLLSNYVKGAHSSSPQLKNSMGTAFRTARLDKHSL